MTAYNFESFPGALADSMKWGRYAGSAVLPMWVADMDFPAPPAVLDALRQRLEQGMLTYNIAAPAQTESVLAHLSSEYGWQVAAEWLVWLPGLVPGLNIACRAAGEKTSPVFTATPIYPPFLSAPGHAGRRLVTVPLQCSHNHWQWDFSRLAQTLTQHPSGGLLLLCHPHNPVGRAWNSEELLELAALAERHNLIVCSDEIHCGLLLDQGLHHQPFAALSPQIARRSMTLMSPSKTYNLPGLATAFAVIPDPVLRQAFRTAMQGVTPFPNLLGMVAAEAAYRDCADWRNALIATLRANRDCLEKALAGWEGLSMAHVEATYLAWIDASEWCRQREIVDVHRFFEQAGVGLSAGRDFGPGYEHFVRLNFACPRNTLDSALARIQATLA